MLALLHFSNHVQGGNQAWHQKFTDSFGLAWPSNRSIYMPGETSCKGMVCWLFFEGKMKYEYGNTRSTLQRRWFWSGLSTTRSFWWVLIPYQVLDTLFLLLLVTTIFITSHTWGVGWPEILVYGPLELGSFYHQGMFLKFMCNIRMGNSLRPCNDRGDNKPWH